MSGILRAMDGQDAFANVATGTTVTVRALKYDHSEYRRWTGQFRSRVSGGVVLEAIFGQTVEGRRG